MSLILQQRIRQYKKPPVSKPNVPKQRAQIKTQPTKPLQKRGQKEVGQKEVGQKREEKKVHYEEQKEEEQKEEEQKEDGQEGEYSPVSDTSHPNHDLELSNEIIHIVSSSDESSLLDTDLYNNTEEDVPYFDQHNIIIGNFIESSDSSVELNYNDTYELSSQVSMTGTPTFDELDADEDLNIDYSNVYTTQSDVFTMDASYDSMISNYTLY